MPEKVRNIEHERAGNTLKFVQALLQDFRGRDFAIELWDGTCWGPEKSQFRRFTWKIKHPEALRRVVFASNRQMALAQGYIYGDFEIEGDIEAVFRLADHLINHDWKLREKLHFLSIALGLPSAGVRIDGNQAHLEGRAHSRERDHQAIQYHYDVSNDFYALWLDRKMLYSCAYFEHADDDIDTAQNNKLDRICRKLDLKPGERLLDIGCGWGALITHAALEYGIRAVGITLSQQQFEWAQKRIRDLGLQDRCEVRLQDYRDVDEPAEFDKLASIGMVEHVGESKLAAYFRQAFRMLRPAGTFLVTGIGRPGRPRPVDDKTAFTDLYIFPDGELVPIATTLADAEQAGFEVREVENLREHYRLTLQRWLRRLESHAEEARRIVGDVKYRTWRLYLAGSAYYFQRGWLDLYYTLLSKE